MIELQTFIRRKAFLTLSACMAVGFAAPHALAGFEWVPKKAPVAEVVSEPIEDAPVSPMPAPANDIILPLPSDSELEEPIVMAPPPAPVVIQEPAPVMPEPTAPTRITVMPKEEPNTGSIAIQAEKPMLPPLEAPMAKEEPIVVSNDPETLKKPPFEMTKTRIIVPDDAPANAVEQVEKRNTVIAAFPSQESLEETKEQPVTFSGESTLTETAADFAEAVGFASDVPLALALRQVVPADFAFSFGNNVNPGLRVSWNGGKPWNEVVADMVTPLGYKAVISQKAVSIVEENQAMAPASPASNDDSSAAMMPMSLEPAAGTEDAVSEITQETRERSVKRVNIMDPGQENAEDNVEEPGLVQKVTRLFEPSPKKESVVESDDVAIVALEDAVSTQQDEPVTITFWTAEAGASLKETLDQWARAANAELVWDATHDFQLQSDFEVQGSFEKAVNLLLKHGVDHQEKALSHSYVTTSSDEKIKIIIDDKA